MKQTEIDQIANELEKRSTERARQWREKQNALKTNNARAGLAIIIIFIGAFALFSAIQNFTWLTGLMERIATAYPEAVMTVALMTMGLLGLILVVLGTKLIGLGLVNLGKAIQDEKKILKGELDSGK